MNLRRLRMLSSFNMKLILIFAIIGLEAMIIYGFRQTPYYSTQSTIQLQNLNLAGASGQFGGLDFDGGSDGHQQLENAKTNFYKPVFIRKVVKSLRKHKLANKLMYKTGSRWYWTRKTRSLNELDDEALLNTLPGFISVSSDHARSNLTVSTRSEFPLTAKVINELFVAAFIEYSTAEAARKIRQSSDFFKEQLSDARDRLAAADKALSEFEKNNPHVHQDSSRSDYSQLKSKSSKLRADIDIKERLLEHFQAKLDAIKITPTKPNHGVRDELLKEVESLEYSKLKYLSEGYVPDHPGIIAIDKRITNLKRVIGRNLASKNEGIAELEGVRAKEITEKIVSLTDQVREKSIELSNVKERLREMASTQALLPAHEAERNRLKRDVDVASQLYLQLKSQVNLMNIRSASENGSWTIIAWPGLPTTPKGVVPFWRLILFGFGIGLALAYSVLIARDSLEPRILHRDDAEILSYHYSGRLSPNLSEQAEVLATLGQISSHYSEDEEVHDVITCASPSSSFGITELSFLTSYLATQRKASLTIVIGEMKVPIEYGAPLNMDYADIYRHPDGLQDLVKVSEKDTFVSLQNLISTSSHKYSAIFLLFKDPASNPSYPLGLKMADKLLLCGAPHSHSFESFLDLTKGFLHRDQVYFAFLQTVKEQRKDSILANWTKGQRENRKKTEFDKMVEAERAASNAAQNAEAESSGTTDKDIA